MNFMAKLPIEGPHQGSIDGLMQHSLGPLVDDGAPWSGLGMEEFLRLQSTIMLTWDGTLDELPDLIRSRPYWQYGNGQHASQKRRILGPAVLTTQSDQGIQINIRHLIIEGSSQWIIGRNVTQYADIIHVNGNYLRFSNTKSNEPVTLQLLNHDMHSYLPSDMFYHSDYHRMQSMNATVYLSIHCTW